MTYDLLCHLTNHLASVTGHLLQQNVISSTFIISKWLCFTENLFFLRSFLRIRLCLTESKIGQPFEISFCSTYTTKREQMGGQGGGGIIKERKCVFQHLLSSSYLSLPSPPPPPPHLGAFLLLSYPPVRIHLHSSLIVSCSGLPLQLAIHLGGGRETAPDLSYRTKQRCMRMPLVAVCGTGSTQLRHRHQLVYSASLQSPVSPFLSCISFQSPPNGIKKQSLVYSGCISSSL